MKYTLHQLAIFGEVARHGSMTKAAKHLHMTQPAVSIQLKQLQETIGLPLVEVVGRKLYLTQAGEKLQKVYENVHRELESFDATVSQLKGGLTGTLTISAASTAKYFLPYLLGEFQQRYPGIDISLKVTNRNEVLNHLESNAFDLAVLTQLPKGDQYKSFSFLDNPLMMGAPPDHRLVGKKNIEISELQDEQFIFRESGSGTRMVMEQFLADHSIPSSPIMKLGTNEAVKQAIMAGIGLSMISGLSVRSEQKLGNIKILDIREFPIMTRWHMVYHKDKRLSPVTVNFLEFLSGERLSQYIPN